MLCGCSGEADYQEKGKSSNCRDPEWGTTGSPKAHQGKWCRWMGKQGEVREAKAGEDPVGPWML